MSGSRRYPVEAMSPADEAWEIIRELVWTTSNGAR